jgi:hypothetical protein
VGRHNASLALHGKPQAWQPRSQDEKLIRGWHDDIAIIRTWFVHTNEPAVIVGLLPPVYILIHHQLATWLQSRWPGIYTPLIAIIGH